MIKRTCYLVLVTALLFSISTHASPTYCSPLTANSSEMSTRQQIVDEFKNRLAKIDSSAPPLANGYQYQTDIGKNDVDEWVTNYNEKQLADAEGKARISVFDTNRTRSEKQTYDAGSVTATLEIQTRCYHLRDLTPAEVRKHLADMAQAVITDPDTGEQDLRFGGQVVDLQIANDGFVIPNEVFTIEASAIGWTVTQEIEPYEQ